MATVEATTSRVQRILVDKFTGVSLTKTGFCVEHGSTAAFVDVRDWGEDPDGNPETLVRVGSPVGRDIAGTPELFKWVATEGQQQFFGGIRAMEQENGSWFLMLEHTLLGDFLDPAELETAVTFVLLAADDLDEKVRSQFGGKRYVDA